MPNVKAVIEDQANAKNSNNLIDGNHDVSKILNSVMETCVAAGVNNEIKGNAGVGASGGFGGDFNSFKNILNSYLGDNSYISGYTISDTDRTVLSALIAYNKENREDLFGNNYSSSRFPHLNRWARHIQSYDKSTSHQNRSQHCFQFPVVNNNILVRILFNYSCTCYL